MAALLDDGGVRIAELRADSSVLPIASADKLVTIHTLGKKLDLTLNEGAYATIDSKEMLQDTQKPQVQDRQALQDLAAAARLAVRDWDNGLKTKRKMNKTRDAAAEAAGPPPPSGQQGSGSAAGAAAAAAAHATGGSFRDVFEHGPALAKGITVLEDAGGSKAATAFASAAPWLLTDPKTTAQLLQAAAPVLQPFQAEWSKERGAAGRLRAAKALVPPHSTALAAAVSSFLGARALPPKLLEDLLTKFCDEAAVAGPPAIAEKAQATAALLKQKLAEPCLFAIAGGVESAYVEMGKLAHVRFTVRGTRQVLLAYADELMELLSTCIKDGPSEAAGAAGPLAAKKRMEQRLWGLFLNMKREALCDYVASGKALFAATVADGNVLYVPAGMVIVVASAASSLYTALGLPRPVDYLDSIAAIGMVPGAHPSSHTPVTVCLFELLPGKVFGCLSRCLASQLL